MSEHSASEAVRIRSDRDDAVARLYDTHREPMVRLAYVLTRNAEASDDVVQDAFVAVHRNWEHVDQPAAYLRRAVINACHSRHRHLRVVRGAARERPTSVDPPAEPFDHELQAALERLSFEHRAVLALRYVEDLDDVTIAASLGVSRATVRTRAHRALEQLRKELAR